VFASDRGGDLQLWTMKADGSDARLALADAPGWRLMAPTYTPVGRGLVYARCQPGDGVCAIWAASADGTGAHALTPFQEERDEAVDFSPDVSPDGTKVAFTRFNWHGSISQIYVMGIDGSNPHPITPPRFEGSTARFTGDGRIVWSTAANRAGAEVRLSDLSGGKGTLLTQTPYSFGSFAPDVSPSGRSLAYVNDAPYRSHCCSDLVVQPLKGKPFRLPLAVNGIFGPRWQPVPPA
jgi:Tol biopolymer transport system component